MIIYNQDQALDYTPLLQAYPKDVPDDPNPDPCCILKECVPCFMKKKTEKQKQNKQTVLIRNMLYGLRCSRIP